MIDPYALGPIELQSIVVKWIEAEYLPVLRKAYPDKEFTKIKIVNPQDVQCIWEWWEYECRHK